MAQPSALGTAVRTAARFDPASISWPAGLLAAIPVVAALGIPFAAGDEVAGVTMGVGAMFVGIAWRATGGRPPLAVMATDSALMALSTFVGCITGNVEAVHLVLLAIWAGMAGLLVSLGNRGAALGTQAILAVVVFGRFNEPLLPALGLAGLVLAGGAAETGFLLLVRWPPPLQVQRRATAHAYRELARLATAPPHGSSLPAGNALDEAEASLANGSLLGDSAVLTMRSIVDEGLRFRVSLMALNGLAARLAPGGAVALTVHDLATRVASALQLAAETIEQRGQPSDELRRAVEQLSVAIEQLSQADPPSPADDADTQLWPVLVRRLAALGGQLRAIASLAPAAGRGGGLLSRRAHARTHHLSDRLRADADAIRANLTLSSPAARHALRLVVVVPLASLISRALPVQHAYWIPVTAAAVLRPEYGATFTRGTERALGTALGVALAGLITAVAHPAGAVTVGLVGVLGWMGYATMPASYAVGYAFITTLVVFLLNVIDPDTIATASARLIDTLIGAAIGLVAYAVWPTWARGPAQNALAGLVEAQRRYLRLVLEALVTGSELTAARAKPAAHAARRARDIAESAVARSLGEPEQRRIDPQVGPGMLSHARRLSQASHVLRLDAEDDRGRGPLPHLASVARAIDVELGAVGRALESDELQLSAEYTDPRSALSAFARSGDPAERELLIDLDELVDAVNSVAELVARTPPSSRRRAGGTDSLSDAGTAAATSR